MSIMKGNNLHGNRVQRSDDPRNGLDESAAYKAKNGAQKAQENEATKKALTAGAKGAATALGTAAARKAVDVASKTKLGKAV